MSQNFDVGPIFRYFRCKKLYFKNQQKVTCFLTWKITYILTEITMIIEIKVKKSILN